MYFGEIYLFQNSPVQPLMQAELTALKGQFVLAPSLQRAAGNKKDGEKKDSAKKDQPKGKKKN